MNVERKSKRTHFLSYSLNVLLSTGEHTQDTTTLIFPQLDTISIDISTTIIPTNEDSECCFLRWKGRKYIDFSPLVFFGNFPSKNWMSHRNAQNAIKLIFLGKYETIIKAESIDRRIRKFPLSTSNWSSVNGIFN